MALRHCNLRTPCRLLSFSASPFTGPSATVVIQLSAPCTESSATSEAPYLQGLSFMPPYCLEQVGVCESLALTLITCSFASPERLLSQRSAWSDPAENGRHLSLEDVVFACSLVPGQTRPCLLAKALSMPACSWPVPQGLMKNKYAKPLDAQGRRDYSVTPPHSGHTVQRGFSD